MPRNRLLHAFLVIFLLPGSAPILPAPEDSAPPVETAQLVIERAVQSGAFPGAAAAVGTIDRVFWLEGFGWLSEKHVRHAEPETIYDLASLTKVIGTTSIILRLLADGKLSLDRPIVDYLPEFAVLVQATTKDGDWDGNGLLTPRQADCSALFAAQRHGERAEATAEQSSRHTPCAVTDQEFCRLAGGDGDGEEDADADADADTDGDNDSGRRAVTVEHLLTHTSGLPAWKPYYKKAASYSDLIERALHEPLESQPGIAYRYSDIGFILLGELASRVGGRPLADQEKDFFRALGMHSTTRSPPPEWSTWVAPTELIPGTKASYYRGVVHDENARAGGGLTGHAGLFSTAVDLSIFAAEWLRALRGESRFFPRELAQKFSRRRSNIEGSSRALGWDTMVPGRSCGNLLSAHAFGHTGFTGTSIWIDPDRELFLILLTNRVHPSRKNRAISQARRDFADAVAREHDSKKTGKKEPRDS